MTNPEITPANCHLLAGVISAVDDRYYQAEGYEAETGRLLIKSRAGNLFAVEIRQIAGTE